MSEEGGYHPGSRSGASSDRTRHFLLTENDTTAEAEKKILLIRRKKIEKMKK